MVNAVTNLGRNGVADWIIQRATSVVLGTYTLFIAVYLLLNPDLGYEQWSTLFSQFWMRAYSFLVLLSIVAHGWIGLWGVLTDYVTERLMGGPALILRTLVLSVYALVCVALLLWGIEILWGMN